MDFIFFLWLFFFSLILGFVASLIAIKINKYITNRRYKPEDDKGRKAEFRAFGGGVQQDSQRLLAPRDSSLPDVKPIERNPTSTIHSSRRIDTIKEAFARRKVNK